MYIIWFFYCFTVVPCQLNLLLSSFMALCKRISMVNSSASFSKNVPLQETKTSLTGSRWSDQAIQVFWAKGDGDACWKVMHALATWPPSRCPDVIWCPYWMQTIENKKIGNQLDTQRSASLEVFRYIIPSKKHPSQWVLAQIFSRIPKWQTKSRHQRAKPTTCKPHWSHSKNANDANCHPATEHNDDAIWSWTSRKEDLHEKQLIKTEP